MDIEKYNVLFSAWRSLIGAARFNMRAAIVHYDQFSITLNCYFDGLLSPDDLETISVAETEISADFSTNIAVEARCIRLDYPQPIIDNGIWIYARQEALGNMKKVIAEQGLDMQSLLDEIHIRRASYKALLGEIRPNMRKIIEYHGSHSIKIEVYFDGPISQEDEETVLKIQQRMEASFSFSVRVEAQCIRYDYPNVIKSDGNTLYWRQEA